jgi:hypothetical protein
LNYRFFMAKKISAIKKLPLSVLLISFFSVLAFIFAAQASADGRFINKKIGDYKIYISQSYETGLGKLVIMQGARKVFESKAIDDHYSFGTNFDNNYATNDKYSGRDITGNGIPNLVVYNWTGGAHCCNFLYVFELGKKFKHLTTVSAGSSNIKLVDLDHDGFPEIEFYDGSIDYLFASYAESPPGRIILKFNKDNYVVKSDLLQKNILSQKTILTKKIEIKSVFMKLPEHSPSLPYDFLKLMMDLSYAGKKDLAMDISNEVWPSKKPGLTKFKKEFTQALNNSEYWRQIK